ncbi:hypothetical protein IRW27_004404 [Escherichia coli]|nr:hypothetical protein [Escherichia coli]
MDEQIKALLNQVRILEQAASEKTGTERQQLQRAAAKVKLDVIKLLPQRGQQQESKVPDPSEYFGSKLPEGFENYFSGDYLTPEMESYFDNLTQEQRDYFTVKVPDNVPDAPKKEPDKTKVFDDWDYRRRVLNALGIPC